VRPRTLSTVVVAVLAALAPAQELAKPPNIVYILADDLGYGELGCYGQTKIRTPHIDRLAAEGMRFLQHYAGAPVCAPSRCVLMTGRHLSHAFIRGNREVQPEGQLPIPADAVTVAELLAARGYATGCIGKWGLGPVGSSGDPNAQGFGLFFGYNCQREAHNFYPQHLWLNGERFLLDNPGFRPYAKLEQPPASYARYYGNEYAPDLMVRMARAFLRQHADRPFFLYLPFIEPHVAMQPPQEWVERYPQEWDEAPYLGSSGYLPHPRPRAGYAAMISHLDDHVGRVVELIDQLGLRERTLIVFSSDNGPTHDVGGADTNFFASAGPLRGRKGSVYEGGLRVPMIARWPGTIAPGASSDHVSGFQDVLPTLVEVAGGTPPAGIDGISFVATLLGRGEQRAHDHLIWEFYEYGGQHAVRKGDWKAVRRNLRRGGGPLELYDLARDVGEQNDVAAAHAEVVAELDAILRTDRTPNPDFRIELLDGR
jgi:arylsulfatase A-like enzyme